jgi:hypothetical protein
MSVNYSNNFLCNYCNKYYKTSQSLWNHKTKFHKNESQSNISHKSVNSQSNFTIKSVNSQLNYIDNKKYKCKHCDKEYLHKQSKHKHEKTCKNNKINNLVEENNKLKEMIKVKEEKYEKELAEIKTQLLIIINKNCKIHPKTLQKINKNFNNTNYGSINNGNITYNIIKFGNENINELLTDKEKIKILNMKYKSIEESIKTIHFNNNRPECQNILITNLRDDIAHVFDGEKFITMKKNEAINELIDNHLENIEISLEEYREKLTPKAIDILDKMIEKLYDDKTPLVDESNSNKKFSNYKLYKIDQIKDLIYNQSRSIKDTIKQINNKITNEIEI